MFAICTDPADGCGKMKDDLRLDILEKILGLDRADKIVARLPSDRDDALESSKGQRCDEILSKESRAARDQDA
jgi:hypothetical protein